MKYAWEITKDPFIPFWSETQTCANHRVSTVYIGLHRQTTVSFEGIPSFLFATIQIVSSMAALLYENCRLTVRQVFNLPPLTVYFLVSTPNTIQRANNWTERSGESSSFRTNAAFRKAKPESRRGVQFRKLLERRFLCQNLYSLVKWAVPVLLTVRHRLSKHDRDDNAMIFVH